LADHSAEIIRKRKGDADVKVEQTEGLKQLKISYDRLKMAQYGLDINSLNQVIRSTVAGQKVGMILERERRFELVIRLNEKYRKNLNLDQLYVRTAANTMIPVSEVASIDFESGPMMISREQAQRKINIGINVRGEDIATLVENIQDKLDKEVKLPPGYRIEYGGAFENLKEASSRLSIAIPVALVTIILLLYMAFKSIKEALIIFTAVPLASIGGIIALWSRGLPFSISAGVGFIALFGVAVLNGIVLVSELNYLKNSGKYTTLQEIIKVGALTRLRPVFMTAVVATLGFFPMALSTSNGAEVQRPLATVVIGGLVTSTLLTLLIVPSIYYIAENKRFKKQMNKKGITLILFFFGGIFSMNAQTKITLSELLTRVSINNPELKSESFQIQKEQVEKKYAYSMNSTTFTLGYGQYNSRKGDYQLEASQDFGNLFSYKKARELSDSRVNWLTTKSVLKKHMLESQVEQLYNQWMYILEKRNLFNNMDSLYKAGLKKAEFRYEKGETDYMEKQFFKVELEQILQQKAMNEQEYLNIENQIYTLCYIGIEENLIPGESFYKLNAFSPADSLNTLYIQEFDKAVEVNQKTLSLEKAQRNPELSVGGMMQSLDQNYNYYAGIVGVSIPLFNNTYKKSREQAKIENQIIEYQREKTMRNLVLRVKQLKEQEKMYGRELNFFGTRHLDELKKMREVATIKYQYGEIDYLQYCSMLKSSVEAHSLYLDLINYYNQTLIELKYITQ
jgi:cobalt-zinc-cadmium resistance protein CzcA